MSLGKKYPYHLYNTTDWSVITRRINWKHAHHGKVISFINMLNPSITLDPITSLSFSPDGQRIVTMDYKGITVITETNRDLDVGHHDFKGRKFSKTEALSLL